MRKTLTELRRRFGILLSDASPVELPDGRWRLYDDARAEIYEHSNEITAEQYSERLGAACEFLEGKAREWLSELKTEMKAASAEQRYEEAASLRDRIDALQRTASRTRKFERNLVGTHNHRQVVKSLKEKLHIAQEPRHMECFDISHISGSFCVASMVAFKDGSPERKSYRRFKIKSFVGNDDFRAMEEVVGRRYRRQDEIGTPFGVTIDFDTIEKDGTFTLRDRDTCEQRRVTEDELVKFLEEQIGG